MPRALAVLPFLLLGLLLAPRPGLALGFEEPPQPGDLTPTPAAPELFRAALAVQLVVPLGRASRQTDHSLGWCTRLLRWLSPRLGVTASLQEVWLAKDRILPSNVQLSLHAATAGVRWEWPLSPQRALFAETYAVFAARTLVNGTSKTTRTSVGAGLAAGASARVAGRIHAVLQVSYATAPHRLAAVEFGFAVGF